MTPPSRPIRRGVVVGLGVGQIVSWGSSYYMIGVLGGAMTLDLGWTAELVYGGFSAALVAMGLVSGHVGAAIGRWGGRPTMTAGSVVGAIACALLASADGVVSYYVAWIMLGIAMRAMLYDAAFAALVHAGGGGAGGPIAQLTLLGGLASTISWPIGHALESAFGWRGAVLCYGGALLAAAPLWRVLPRGDARAGGATLPATAPLAAPPLDQGRRRRAAVLFATVVAATNGLAAGMSSHMIPMLAELGLGAAAAVGVASLPGIGQSTARLVTVVFARRLSPIGLNLLAASALPAAFALALSAGGAYAAAVGFALAYGAGNGVLSITRGTVPLALFEPAAYGAAVGRLLAPGFVIAAAAPTAFAWLIDGYGARSAAVAGLALGSTAFAAALLLRLTASGWPGSRGR